MFYFTCVQVYWFILMFSRGSWNLVFNALPLVSHSLYQTFKFPPSVPPHPIRLRLVEKVLQPLRSQHYVRTGRNPEQLHFGSQIPAPVRDTAQHRCVGGGHLWACSARRSGGTTPFLPAGETVQSAERWGQVGLNPGTKLWEILKRNLNLSLSPQGFGGRRKECSPAPRGNTSTPSLCPASFVTTATSLTSRLTRSRAQRGRRTCWPAHTRSSPTSTSARGKNRTQVRKWKKKTCWYQVVFSRLPVWNPSDLSSSSQLRSDTQDSIRLLAALWLCDSVSVSLWLQAAGIFFCQLWSDQPAVEPRTPNMSRYKA